MIPTSQIFTIITEQFPELRFEGDTNEQDIYGDSEKMAIYAISLLDNGKFDKVKRFFGLLDELYAHCEKKLATVLDKTLIRMIGKRIEIHNSRWDILTLLPERLKELMQRELVCV